jgi:hypothetical protein
MTFPFITLRVEIFAILSCVTSRHHSTSPPPTLAPVLWLKTHWAKTGYGKKLVWLGETEWKLAKLSTNTFTYRSSSYEFNVFNRIDLFFHRFISTRRRICWLGTLCGVGACARSGQQQGGRRAGCRSGWGEPVPRAWRQGWKKPGFLLTSPVFFLFFWFFLYICPEERVFRGFFSFKNTFRCIHTLNYNHSY